MSQTEIDNLIELLARLPGIGPRSARRLALSMLKKPDSLMRPLAKSLLSTADSIVKCSICGNLDTSSPCYICLDESRDKSTIISITGCSIGLLKMANTYRIAKNIVKHRINNPTFIFDILRL